VSLARYASTSTEWAFLSQVQHEEQVLLHSLSDEEKPGDIICRCPPKGPGAIAATDYLPKVIIRMAFAQISGLSPEVGSLVVSVAGALVLGAVQTPRRVPAESDMGWV
jgi:hypothetical protein